MNNEEIRNFINSLNINHQIFYGDNKNKIEAINANLKGQKFDVLILVADDMIPIVKDYDVVISNIIDESPHGLDIAVHLHTARWSDLLDVWCVMGKKYYDRFKYIYHPDYKSIFADNEYTEVATKLGKRVFSVHTPFYHDWDDDDTAKKNYPYNTEDWHVYENRKQRNYDLDKKNNKKK
jgi:hypothetical protein